MSTDAEMPKPKRGRLLICGIAGVALLAGALLYLGTRTKQLLKSVEVAQPNTRHVKTERAEADLIPFDCEYDENDMTIKLMREKALSLARAMDDPKHPCNPLNTSKTKITGVKIKPLTRGNKMYVLWLSDGATTCGLEVLHSEGQHPEIFKGDFFTSFFLKEFEGGPVYSRALMDEVLKPDKKRFRKQDIGEAAREIMRAVCGEEFFNNTLPQEFSGFSVSDALNVIYVARDVSPPSSGNAFTKNVIKATLRRTDVPQADPYDTFWQTKAEVYIQAEPSNSPLAFKVVYVNANNNGFDLSKLGADPNAARRGNRAGAVRLR